MTHRSRAATVLEAVLMGVELPSARNGNLQILGAWTEEPDTICVVYQGWWYPGIVGLRQHIGSTDWPMETVVLNILTEDLGEPLGSLVHSLEPDEHGVMWWSGTSPGSWTRY
ncbi:MAG TPA: hypothetical protein VF165_08330 [Nocardioidaceae bacterium]